MVSTDQLSTESNGNSISTSSETPQFTEQHAAVSVPKCANDPSTNLTGQDFGSDCMTTMTTTASIIDTGTMSKQTYNSFQRVARYLHLCLVALGIVLNTLNILVFTQKVMRSATSTILTCLSCCEMGFAICELILSSCATSLGRHAYTSKLYWTLLRWVRIYMATVFQRSAFCFNFSVATERFIAVSFPLKSKHILRRKNPVVFCIILFLAIVSIHIFNPLKMDVVAINIGHGYIHLIQDSQLYKESSDLFEGLTLATKVIFAYIPLLGCLLMNVIMVMALKKHSKNRKMLQTSIETHQKNDRQEVQMTITVLVSSLLFVLFSLPVTTSSIVKSLNPEYGNHKREHYLYTFITYLTGLLSLLGLSMDFLVYVILSRKFRQTFFHLVSCCLGHRRKRKSSFIRSTATTISTMSDLDSKSHGGSSCEMSTRNIY